MRCSPGVAVTESGGNASQRAGAPASCISGAHRRSAGPMRALHATPCAGARVALGPTVCPRHSVLKLRLGAPAAKTAPPLRTGRRAGAGCVQSVVARAASPDARPLPQSAAEMVDQAADAVKAAIGDGKRRHQVGDHASNGACAGACAGGSNAGAFPASMPAGDLPLAREREGDLIHGDGARRLPLLAPKGVRHGLVRAGRGLSPGDLPLAVPSHYFGRLRPQCAGGGVACQAGSWRRGRGEGRGRGGDRGRAVPTAVHP